MDDVQILLPEASLHLIFRHLSDLSVGNVMISLSRAADRKFLFNCLALFPVTNIEIMKGPSVSAPHYSPFKNIHPVEDAEFLDQPIARARTVYVWHLIASRNTWHDTTSKIYKAGDSLFDEPSGADEAIRSLRKKGTYFEIKPRVALEIEVGKHVAIFVHINTTSPLKGWSIPRAWADSEVSPTLRDAIEAFRVDSRGSGKSGWPLDIQGPDIIVGFSREPMSDALWECRLDSNERVYSSKGVAIDSCPEEFGGELYNAAVIGEVALRTEAVQLAAISIDSSIITSG